MADRIGGVVVMLLAILVIATLALLTVLFPSVGASEDTVYDFMSFASARPDQHLIVVGRHAQLHEQQLATQLSSSYGIPVKQEPDVQSRDGLILIGTPQTNLLLDKELRDPYSTLRPVVLREGPNLLVIVSTQAQAQEASTALLDYTSPEVRLSPRSVPLGLGSLPVYIITFVVIIPLLLIILERHRRATRKKVIADDEVKLRVLQEYIGQYTKDGHSEGEITTWLTSHGYAKGLVEQAVTAYKTLGDSRYPGMS